MLVTKKWFNIVVFFSVSLFFSCTHGMNDDFNFMDEDGFFCDNIPDFNPFLFDSVDDQSVDITQSHNNDFGSNNTQVDCDNLDRNNLHIEDIFGEGLAGPDEDSILLGAYSVHNNSAIGDENQGIVDNGQHKSGELLLVKELQEMVKDPEMAKRLFRVREFYEKNPEYNYERLSKGRLSKYVVLGHFIYWGDKALHKCCYCGRVFNDGKNLSKHLQYHHYLSPKQIRLGFENQDFEKISNIDRNLVRTFKMLRLNDDVLKTIDLSLLKNVNFPKKNDIAEEDVGGDLFEREAQKIKRLEEQVGAGYNAERNKKSKAWYIIRGHFICWRETGFKCCYCGAEFTSSRTVKRHLMNDGSDTRVTKGGIGGHLMPFKKLEAMFVDQDFEKLAHIDEKLVKLFKQLKLYMYNNQTLHVRPSDNGFKKRTLCDYCGNDYTSEYIKDHMKRCTENPNRVKRREKCVYCGNKYASLHIKIHMKRCAKNPNKQKAKKRGRGRDSSLDAKKRKFK